MFTSVIGSLASALPRYFIFGCYVPTLIFFGLNGALLYLHAAWIRGAVQNALHEESALFIATTFVTTIVAAYILSSLSNFLRETLEGRNYLPPGLANELRAAQRARFEELATAFGNARQLRYLLSSSIPQWQERLRVAASEGAADHQGQSNYSNQDPAALALRDLKRLARRKISHRDELASAVSLMADALRSNDKRVTPELGDDQRELIIVIGRIANRARQSEYELATSLQAYPPSGEELLPTRMGNIAASLQGYGVDHYGFDLTVFLSRLQAVLASRSDDRGYSSVLETKTQLDFLVACCWLLAVTTVVWTISLGIFGSSLLSFAYVVVVGPLLVWVFYSLGVESYCAYAEALRACVDMNRFTLLRALEIPLPATIGEERRLWSALSRQTLTGNDFTDVSYDHTLS